MHSLENEDRLQNVISPGKPSPTLMQNSPPNINVVSRRRSHRLSSQKSVDFNACSSTDVVEVSDGEHGIFDRFIDSNQLMLEKLHFEINVLPVPRAAESNDKNKQTEGMRIETLPKKDSSSQSSPIALRTRSRSRCSSVESDGTGTTGDTQKANSVVLTPNKMNAVRWCQKKTSMMPQLEEIAEEQQKCKEDDSNDDKLMEKNIGTKKFLRRKGKLSTNERAHEVCAEKRSMEKSGEKGAPTEDIADEQKLLTQMEQKITENSWNESKSPMKSPAKTSAKPLTRNCPKKLHMKNSDGFLQDSAKISLPKNSVTVSSSSTTEYSKQGAKLNKTNLEENGLNIWPKLDGLLTLWLRCGEQSILVDSIERAYTFVNNVDTGVPAISEELITSDSETIWQQIAYGNKKFHRYFTKTKHFLDIGIPTDKELIEDRVDSLRSIKFQDECSGNTKCDSNDFCKLTEGEVKRFDTDLNGNKMDRSDDNCSNASSSEDFGFSGVPSSVSRKRWKSAADDRFFSLAEMEEYLDAEERHQTYQNESFFEQFDKHDDDLQNSRVDYHYADFYGDTNSTGGENGSKTTSNELNKSRRDSQSVEVNNRTEKRVTFADEIIGDLNCECDKEDSHQHDEEPTILLGQVDEEEDNETEFRHRQKKLQERILSIEQANLAPRSWDLSGEVTAIERGENTMLEKHLDFDQSAPCAPIITVDTTAQLEAKIIQRIKDRAFDDVVRTECKPEANVTYRAPVVESEIVKKSLAEVYEEQYQKTQYGVKNEEKTNEKHEEIKKLVSLLFQKLNALSHYRCIPSEVHPEVRVLTNMPSLRKEEVGPIASTDAVLLAPEEIHKHASGPIKGDDEKTKTDRSRLRRKKRKWQHIEQLKKQETEIPTVKNEAPPKKTKLVSQYDSKRSNMKLTSTSFFEHLQTKTTEEVKNTKYKVTKMGATKKKLSTNYKL
ncbi:unnamed protein product [Litomosoides sigmodontis]|uniref:Uncharacterized protein n=1 Tax=Litomosoides sigmodontis TaxID=42156 RepID=A0A3P6U2G2_LITSI|nr:unnamed protein product [Litomosoides sigmodontis]